MRVFPILATSFSAAMIVIVAACSGPELPPHTLADDSPLPNGRRIQLNSTNPELTKEECIVLINAYRDKAGKEGQVSVRKPSKVLDGKATPWCIENFDGQGIDFNDHMF